MNNKPTLKSSLKAYLYLLPALTIMSVFIIYPLIKSFIMSFYGKYNYFKDIVYSYTLDNYKTVLTDPTFWRALKNTMIFVLGVVPTSIILSILIALMLNSKIRFKGLFRTCFFMPYVTSLVAVSIVWRWIYHKDYGILNYFLNLVGIHGISWLDDPNVAMIALIILAIWKNIGYNVIIFLAGLQTIDKQYELAAQIDGANYFKRVWHIIIPLLAPTTLFVTIVSVIGSFKVFDEVYALFSYSGSVAGPSDSALTVVFYIFRKFYGEWNFGVASAASFILFLIIMIFTGLQFWYSKRRG
ncbi:carbohydrate ABC transporter membrane protein 1, CUT1 family (TC 3.A.1.1.-) [Clostridium acidisoli DSM 12555]|uniref:Carbohydrate ABC transporter membrane protein 1, CUT1 family (TC 3.A.1.1.-) n=1 Tax=Clostridium acidisoli DSM 12555 TaxID=1121291 RepID=A0A1W1XJR8_9CLOT|nr:sugar ABC transporter permease [Clostridium acidisoli]SMC24014.1 carbohydrate ABC transporter membrane protein 1, CUT1 family (TC 3.A.1.1.-) [Clostridium acidisoli DSM 12555]